MGVVQGDGGGAVKSVKMDGVWLIERGDKRKTYFCFYVDCRPSWTKRKYMAQQFTDISSSEDVRLTIEDRLRYLKARGKP